MPKKLSDLQRVLVANAAKRATLRLLPPPKSLAKNAGTIATSIKSMLSAGLLETVPAKSGDTIWADANNEDRVTVIVTAAGLAAIGIEPTEGTTALPSEPISSPPARAAIEAASNTPREGTKLASLIAMLSGKSGATLAEIAAATQWQHHSIRGAISGALKKKLGLKVLSEIVEGRGRTYRIEPAAGVASVDRCALC